MAKIIQTSQNEHNLIRAKLPEDARQKVFETRLVVENEGLSLRAQANIEGHWVSVDQSISEKIAFDRIANQSLAPSPPAPPERLRSKTPMAPRPSSSNTSGSAAAKNDRGRHNPGSSPFGRGSSDRSAPEELGAVVAKSGGLSNERRDMSGQSMLGEESRLLARTSGTNVSNIIKPSESEDAFIRSRLPDEVGLLLPETRLVIENSGLSVRAQAKVGERWISLDRSVSEAIASHRILAKSAHFETEMPLDKKGLQNAGSTSRTQKDLRPVSATPARAHDPRQEKVNAYLTKMAQPKEWGTGVEVQALANVTHRDIHVVNRSYTYDAQSDTTTSSFHTLIFRPEGLSRQGGPLGLLLTGVGELSAGGHFEPLRPGVLSADNKWSENRLNGATLPVAGDGDCLFTSVALLVNSSKGDLRGQSIDWLKKNIFQVTAQNQPLDDLAEVALLFED